MKHSCSPTYVEKFGIGQLKWSLSLAHLMFNKICNSYFRVYAQLEVSNQKFHVKKNMKDYIDSFSNSEY